MTPPANQAKPIRRAQLWREVFPPSAPLAEDVDFTFLASPFALAGGDIRNVTLVAAFLAADDGCRIGMAHVVRALAEQFTRQGRAPSVSDFKQYYGLVGRQRREDHSTPAPSTPFNGNGHPRAEAPDVASDEIQRPR